MKRRTFLQTLGACGLAASGIAARLGNADANAQAIAAPLKSFDALSRDAHFRRALLFADTLLQRRGEVGAKSSALWPAVIDTRDMSIPVAFNARKTGEAAALVTSPVPPIPGVRDGVRDGDRAVGGSNLLHEVATLHLLPILDEMTQKPRYAEAAQSYCREFLERAQNPQTGLLGWGEHLFFDLRSERVSIHPKYSERGQWPHELLTYAPPWEMLWQANAGRTARAIAGLRLHFYDQKPGALFNRHAHWDKNEQQKAGTEGESQPWIKHSGLYAHAFAFLHHKTGEKQWLEWARWSGDIYWNARNPQTGLTPSCLTDPRPQARLAGADMTHLAASLYRAYQLSPQETAWRERSLALFKAYDRFAYDAQKDVYLTRFPTDGSVAVGPKNDKKKIIESEFSTSWNEGYGNASTLPLRQGRVGALLARGEKDAACLNAARRVHRLARAQPLTPQTSLSALSDALHLSLDLHDLTAESLYLKDAHFYADEAIARFWRQNERGALIARAQDDPFYEAKVGGGSLALGFLRLGLKSAPKGVRAWSFDF